MTIPGIERSDRATIKAFQDEELRKVVSYVHSRSAYYRRMFEENGLSPDDIQTVEDLRRLPLTSKDDLQGSNKDFLCVPPEEIIDYVRTSGTQGEPVTIALTDNDLERLAYNESISFACAGIAKEDILQLMTTIDRQFMAGMAYFLGARKLGAAIIRVGSVNPEMHWDSILNLRPTYLIAVPSFLIKLIEHAREKGIDLASTSVKGVLCIGEPVREQDFSMNSLALRIKEEWDIALYSTYASTEMSTAFTECAEQNGGHHHPELVIIEVLDPAGDPVPEGTLGELTITTLGVEGMPLMRFQTGDIVAAYDEPCSCGRQTTRLGPIFGRRGQMIKYRGTTLYPPAVVNVLNQFEGIDSFVIDLSTNEVGMDEVRLKLAADDPTAPMIEDIKNRFRAKLRVVPELEFLSTKEVNALRFPKSGRKPVLVVDRRGE